MVQGPTSRRKARVTLTSKGQITLPIELRRRWNLQAGDQLDFAIDDSERVVVRRLARGSVLTNIVQRQAPRDGERRFLDFAREVAAVARVEPRSSQEIREGIAAAVGGHAARSPGEQE